MSFLGSIGKAITGAVKDVVGGLGGLGDLAKIGKSILDSPIGALLKTAFPPLALAGGALNLASMFGDLANGVGAGQNY